jgi:NTP pyrophosphatase (non-canonical NTP hydrolase)
MEMYAMEKKRKRTRTLDFGAYQREAWKTDKVKEGGDALVVPLLGLAGEVGSVLVEHKKWLRDKEKHRFFKDRVAEELGDVLWYIANVASKTGLDLEVVARQNLHKVRARYGSDEAQQHLFFDEAYPVSEQLPRHFAIEFRMEDGRLRLYRDGTVIGDPLTDNAYVEDGYRYHDVFHFAYAAVLGWSPVTRALLDCKRRSAKDVDRVDDGGRAGVTEEGISQLVYQYAKTRDMLRGAKEIDQSILKTIQNMTADFEVARRTPADWERAILVGFDVWDNLHKNGGGTVTVDLMKGSIFYATLPAQMPKRAKALGPDERRSQGKSARRTGARR